MTTATSNVVNVNRRRTSDPRFDMRLTEKFDDDDATSVGWTWVAAILIAGTLIVSGYLDQETTDPNGRTVVTSGEKYVVNTTNAQTPHMTGASAGRDKGY